MAHELMDPRKLTLDPSTQQRAGGEPPEKIEEYAGKYKDGVEFPPIEGYSDGEHVYVWDGHIRTQAAIHAKLKEVRVNVRRGDLAKAVLASLGCNEAHGLPRTAADRHKAIRAALALPGNERISAGDLAKLCSVSKPLAAEIKKQLKQDEHQARQDAAPPASNGDGQQAAPAVEAPKPDVVTVHKKDGSTYEMKTGNIGKGATGRPPKKGGVKAAIADQAEKEAAQREPDEPLKDEAGAVVPEKLASVWDSGARFRAIAKLLDDCRKLPGVRRCRPGLLHDRRGRQGVQPVPQVGLPQRGRLRPAARGAAGVGVWYT